MNLLSSKDISILSSELSLKSWSYCCNNSSSRFATETLFVMTLGQLSMQHPFRGPVSAQPNVVLITYGPSPWLLTPSHGSKAFETLLLINNYRLALIVRRFTSLRKGKDRKSVV